ncbi:XRE family transcriptional regulator [Streptacidiphilus cavernicola]|uniref:XRE family transcriptional regulator n=1 Tax=Streptacidiphilus cavernicola TaxID=3342716 RepID=A0ABV6VY07_9ACTN
MTSRPKAGSKADRDALRTEMTAAGATLAAVAIEMRTRWGYRPREAWRHAHGWSLNEAADRINTTAGDTENPTYTDASQLGKWEKWPAPSSRRPPLAALALLSDTYRCSVEDLLDLDDRRSLPDSDLRILRATTQAVPTAPTTVVRESPAPEPVASELVLLAAGESASWAQWAEASNVGDIALEQLLADVRTLSLEYLTGDPMVMFTRTRRLRDRVFALLEGHQPPRQASDLYVAAGYLCGLLSWMSSDLGHLSAADTQGRTAWLCAELAGHDGLRAWVLSTRSKIAFWDGRYREAINHARRGAGYAVPGSAAVLLALQEADAWAELGATAEAEVALARATTAREQQNGEDEIGGLFSCDRVRQGNYTSAVHLRARRPADALAEADSALKLLNRQAVRASGTEAQIHIIRATAHLAAGSVDGTYEALRPVLAMPPEKRLDTVAKRLQQLAAAIGRGHLGTVAGRDIQGAVEVYCRESAPKLALSPSDAGPAWITG